MAQENWKTMLADANLMLKDYGAQLHTEKEDNCYSLYIEWNDGETERYAQGYYANELEQLILDAKLHAYENSNERVIRFISVLSMPSCLNDTAR